MKQLASLNVGIRNRRPPSRTTAVTRCKTLIILVCPSTAPVWLPICVTALDRLSHCGQGEPKGAAARVRAPHTTVGGDLASGADTTKRVSGIGVVNGWHRWPELNVSIADCTLRKAPRVTYSFSWQHKSSRAPWVSWMLNQVIRLA
ncbi:unnamed protein product [Schistocephalus solidus]|uniref:LysR family transcriptional regulator n=1 Tax=Schistocephalus solidus TaxID=70667 RepID=A0A183SD60_SCHSO|nr:unnamed protein product [Schistocephalus solidus]